MSAAVAGGHGGDAGGDPPPPPNRIPTSCQASAKQKKKRGISVSKNLDKAFEANDNKPLPIEFDLRQGTFKPIGDQASKFTRYIGNYIGQCISPQYPSWKDVPVSDKKSIVRRLQRFFILDTNAPEWPDILAGIERSCQDIYRDRKSCEVPKSSGFHIIYRHTTQKEKPKNPRTARSNRELEIHALQAK